MIFNKFFANFLIEKGAVSSEDIEKCLASADEATIPLYTEIISSNLLSEEDSYRLLAEFFGIEYRFCQISEISLDLIKNYPREKCIEYLAIPFSLEDETLTVLCSDPFCEAEFHEFLPFGGKKLKLFLSTPTRMREILDYVNNKIQQNIVLTDCSESNVSLETDEKNSFPIDAPIIKLCDSILKDAVTRGASDIHIEPFQKSVFIRFRIDGKLTKVDELSTHLYPALLARFKIVSDLNIAERRLPQDGKISTEINDTPYDFRVSTIPTIYGEKLVIRIYNSTFSSNDLAILGFSEHQIKQVLRMITRPYGILLLTGPTGSGKSTTLYTFLRYLNREDTNIVTVEDPIENEIVGINQVQVNPKANLTFATALRAFLRQDPNIIMIGEIRDEETAQIATRAAITGHLVLSSIHTNDACGTVTRLMNMGIPKYLVADALLGVISQRLVRKLCPKCKRPKLTSDAERKLLNISEPHEIYEAVGCPYCNNTGYLGRVGVFEIMVLNDEMRSAILTDDFTSEKLRTITSKSMTSILDNTRTYVLNGITSIQEFDSLVDIVSISK